MYQFINFRMRNKKAIHPSICLDFDFVQEDFVLEVVQVALEMDIESKW